ncbi:MAG: hypothetical protein HY226_05420 [Candidatus Vogelbacteria bacterium]|nr:hypothetical protein [Candidatus Vogelbacteria bacterium]
MITICAIQRGKKAFLSRKDALEYVDYIKGLSGLKPSDYKIEEITGIGTQFGFKWGLERTRQEEFHKAQWKLTAEEQILFNLDNKGDSEERFLEALLKKIRAKLGPDEAMLLCDAADGRLSNWYISKAKARALTKLDDVQKKILKIK